MKEFRIAEEKDLNQLAQMRYEYWLEDGHENAERDKGNFIKKCEAFLREGLITKQWTYWIAIINGEIVSNIFVQRVIKVPKPSKLNDTFGYVTNVYTKPLYRDQGIGANLLINVQKWAKDQDLEFLISWPSEDSIRFYQRAGFLSTEAMEYSVRPYVN